MTREIAVRDAFMAAAGGMLRVESTALVTESAGTRLHVTGFHRDGTPFAVETAPFNADTVHRAYRLAQDILAAHTGVMMPAPAAIAGLAQNLREHLKAATERASALSQRAQASVQNLHGVRHDPHNRDHH